ncbi:uncharacterized protein [Nerophis lumbriciformis]|uniref:uncharacterized protein n=1 Tax=Nerophis lumbriciformis TaxID=546530 RepID=UPI003BAD6EAC
MADNISCSVAEVQILSLLETIKHTQDQLMAKVNFLTSRLTITPGPEVEIPANIQFPLEQLEAVEAFLNEPSNGPARQRVISSLATIGGQDVKRVTWNILGRMFTDDVSDQINWKGVNNKKAFSRMATKTLLFMAPNKADHRKDVDNNPAGAAEIVLAEVSTASRQETQVLRALMDRAEAVGGMSSMKRMVEGDDPQTFLDVFEATAT